MKNMGYNLILGEGTDVLLGMIAFSVAIGVIGLFLVYCLIRLIIFLVKLYRKIKRRRTAKQTAEIVSILGFDPYKKVTYDDKDLYGNESKNKNDSDYAKKIKECIKEVGISEKSIEKYGEYKLAAQTVLVGLELTLSDLNDILTTTNAVNEKIKEEIASLSLTRKMARRNRRKINELGRELGSNSTTILDVTDKAEDKSHEITLVKEAIAYLDKCLENENEKYDKRRAQIEQAHGEGNVELEQIRSYNRASEILTKNSELKKLLININVKYREYTELTQRIDALDDEKREIKITVNDCYSSMGKIGQLPSAELSQKINRLNKRAIEIDEEKSSLIASRDSKNKEVEALRENVSVFLQMGKYSFDDIVLAEDKVVGDLKYDALVRKLEERRLAAMAKIEELEKTYQAIALKMTKRFRRRNEKAILEVELQNTVSELNDARIELKKVQDDVEFSLPNISPLSIMRSGNGYISQKWVTNRAPSGAGEYKQALLRIRDDYAKTVELGDKAEPNKKREILEKLDELERIVAQDAVEVFSKTVDLSAVNTTAIAPRKEQLRSVIIEMRNALKFVRSKEDAVALRKKIYNFGRTLSDEDLADSILAELIVRTMNDAKLLGEQAEYVKTGIFG